MTTMKMISSTSTTSTSGVTLISLLRDRLDLRHAMSFSRSVWRQRAQPWFFLCVPAAPGSRLVERLEHLADLGVLERGRP
jgi:hypothetical protein